MYTYRLLAIGALYLAQPYILKKMKVRRMEREVVAEAERITFESARMRS